MEWEITGSDLALISQTTVRETPPSHPRTVLLSQVNLLLDELARTCKYSNLPPAPLLTPSRSKSEIILELFSNQNDVNVKWLVRIILQRMDPMSWTPNSFMAYFHSQMVQIYNYRADLRKCSAIIDTLNPRDSFPETLEFGTCYASMKNEKGKSAEHIVAYMKKAGMESMYCELKYDGERMQIHYDSTCDFDN